MSKFDIVLNNGILHISDNARKTGTSIKLSDDGCCFEVFDGKKFGLLQFYEIVTYIGAVLRRNYDEEHPWDSSKCKQGKYLGIKKWAITKTCKAIARRICKLLKELRQNANPTALLVQRKVFCNLGPKIYTINVNKLLDKSFYETNSKWCETLKEYDGAICWIDEQIVPSHQWTRIFTRSKKTKLPAPVMESLKTAKRIFLKALRAKYDYLHHITRPITNIFEQRLIGTALLSGYSNIKDVDLLIKSSKEEMKKALKLCNEHFNAPCDLRKSATYRNLFLLSDNTIVQYNNVLEFVKEKLQERAPAKKI